MRHETQVDLLRRFIKHRTDRTTELTDEITDNDVAVYTDPERAALERQRIFRRMPLVAGLSGDLPSTGDRVAVDLGEVPVLLVRSEDGQVRAFLNACRHRGSRLSEGHDHAGRVMTCPYHAWTYDLDGELLGQPLARDGFAGLDRSCLGLRPLPAAEVGGLLLVHPYGDAPLDGPEWASGLDRELGEWPFDDFRFFAEEVVNLACNWKLAYDTFLEGYHVFSLHARTVGRGILSTPAVGDVFGRHTRSVLFAKDTARHTAETPEDGWDLKRHASIVYQLFPNAVINLPLSGHAELWQVYPHPTDPGRCRAHLRFYTPSVIPDGPEGDKARAFYQRNLEFTAEVVLTEDFDQQEAIQVSMASGLMDRVIYGRNEPPLQRFHAALARLLA